MLNHEETSVRMIIRKKEEATAAHFTYNMYVYLRTYVAVYHEWPLYKDAQWLIWRLS